MRLSLTVLAFTLLTIPLRADQPTITVVTKDGRHAGTLSVAQVEIKTDARPVKIALADITSVQFGDIDVIRTRAGKRIKGIVSVDGWELQESAEKRSLARADLRFIVPQISLGQPRKGQIVDAAAANGMTYHVRIPPKYDAKTGAPAIVLFHGSNAYSADYLLGITQRWPKVAADYVLIGIDGEWPTQKDPDGPPTFVYTYVDFVGKSMYKGFPGTDRESPALVAEAIAEIRQQLKLTKIFVTGHSQGGFLVYSCLMNYPDLFAGGMPISAGLIFQCEPTAYEDPAIRQLQRKLPIVILHGEQDPLVSVQMAKSAHESFLHDGFPMLRLLLAKQAAHAFISLPFEDGIRWLESMTADDPRASLGFAEQAFTRRDYRDATAYLRRAQDLDQAGKHAAPASALRQKIENLAAAPAKTLEAAIRQNENNRWVRDFDDFRRQFEFTDAAVPVMDEYAKLHKLHEPPAEKKWAEARQAFSKDDKDRGYQICEEIVSSCYASTYYRYAKQALDEKRATQK